jgi:hypothetical protein
MVLLRTARATCKQSKNVPEGVKDDMFGNYIAVGNSSALKKVDSQNQTSS